MIDLTTGAIVTSEAGPMFVSRLSLTTAPNLPEVYDLDLLNPTNPDSDFVVVGRFESSGNDSLGNIVVLDQRGQRVQPSMTIQG